MFFTRALLTSFPRGTGREETAVIHCAVIHLTSTCPAVRVLKRCFFASLLLACAGTLLAHPVPDIPVRANFAVDGSATIAVEIDPRCFSDQALHEPYLENAVLQAKSNKEKEALFAKSKTFINDTLGFRFEPTADKNGPALGEPRLTFTTLGSQPLPWNAETPADNRPRIARMPVTITATYTFDARALKSYQLHAKPAGKFSVQFINHIGDTAQRLHVLFPGESSYRLEVGDP